MVANSTASAEYYNQNNTHLGDTKLPPLILLAETIVLVRHGKSAGNVLSHRPRKDFYLPHGMTDETLPLTDRGKLQASKTGKWLAETYPDGFDVIIASPFLRAQKTAEFACRAAGWDSGRIISEPLAGERDWGVFLDVHSGQQRDFIDVLRRDRRGGRIPGGESLDEARARAHGLLKRIHAEYTGKRVIVFTHGEFMQECAAAALEELNQLPDLVPHTKPKNCQVFELSLQSLPLQSTPGQSSPSDSIFLEKRWRLRTASPAEADIPSWKELC
jgi:broad specificity phosphatase PhoE